MRTSIEELRAKGLRAGISRDGSRVEIAGDAGALNAAGLVICQPIEIDGRAFTFLRWAEPSSGWRRYFYEVAS